MLACTLRLTLRKLEYTVNVDIFACINVRRIVYKWAISRVLKFAFPVHLAVQAIVYVVFTVHIFSRIFKKRELRENMYSAKMSRNFQKLSKF